MASTFDNGLRTLGESAISGVSSARAASTLTPWLLDGEASGLGGLMSPSALPAQARRASEGDVAPVAADSANRSAGATEIGEVDGLAGAWQAPQGETVLEARLAKSLAALADGAEARFTLALADRAFAAALDTSPVPAAAQWATEGELGTADTSAGSDPLDLGRCGCGMCGNWRSYTSNDETTDAYVPDTAWSSTGPGDTGTSADEISARLEDNPDYQGEPREGTVGVAASGNQQTDGILSGVRWNAAFITYSDPDASADYQAGYYSDGNGNSISAQFEGFGQISAQQLVSVHFALNSVIFTQPVGSGGFSVEGFTNLTLDYAGAGSSTGTIRVANSSDPGTSYAYYPNPGIYGGDVWMGTSARFPDAGDYDWYTSIHELGHALGLKHGHETGGYGALPASVDSTEYSVMTYRSYVGHDLSTYFYTLNAPDSFPQTWMMFDIQALQYMHGADYTTNSTDTVYTWATTGETYVNGNLAINPVGNKIYATIWDGGGNDTYDLSNYTTNLSLDLGPGDWSTFSSAQLANLDAYTGASHFAAGNIANALMFGGNTASLIENAIGGSGNDNIYGNQISNRLTGNAGNDFLYGDDGNDSLYGGLGDDTQKGAGGADYLFGDDGADFLYGGTEGDTLDGWTGNDVLYGEEGNDVLLGFSGNDTLDGGAGNDTVNGESGDDTLTGGTGVDTVYGGDGNDFITDTNSGFGDLFDGGTGIDTLVADFTWVDAVLYDLALGWMKFPGAGGTTYDTITGIENLTTAGGADVNGNADANVITILDTGFDHGNTINAAGGDDVVSTGIGNDVVNGDDGNDTLNGGAGNDTVNGGNGDDTFIDTEGMGASDDDVYNGGAGTDTLVHDLNWVSTVTFNLATGFSTFGGNRDQLISIENLTVGGSATVIGDGVNNVLRVNGTGANLIVGGGGADTIYGGGGNDTIEGGFVTDDIYGEDGDDLLRVLAGEFYDNNYGGNGTDTLDHSAANYSGNTFDFLLGQISGGNTNSVTAVLSSIEIYRDGSGNNTIISNGSGQYYGNGGNDYMFAGLGVNETLDGGAGTDTIDTTTWGGDYVLDMVTGVTNYVPESYVNFENAVTGAGNDSVTGTAGANNISTGDGNDTVNGGNGNDTIDGGNGNDSLTGGSGIDSVSGGAGDDVIVDTAIDIGDFIDGGAGIDTLVADITWNPGVTYDLAAGWMRFPGPGGTIEDTILGIENLTAGGAANVTGTAGANIITITDTGSFHDNTINAAGGNDVVSAGIGNDIVDGGDGDDSLSGGDGNDNLSGGNGTDTLRGGNGNDVLSQNFGGPNEILDGGAGTDTADWSYSVGNNWSISLAAGTALIGATVFAQLTSIENVVGGQLADTITGNAGNNRLEGRAGNDTVNGGDGNDTIDGGTGDDSMLGGLGDDLYYVDSALDVVKEGAGAGLDTVFSSLAAYTLTKEVENLTLTGVGSQSGKGNVLANVILGQNGSGNSLDGAGGDDSLVGGSGDDTLNGGTGSDTMVGGVGNDSYRVSLPSDVIVELLGQGIDRVDSTAIIFELPDHVENLSNLLDTGTQTGRGNALDNLLTGVGADDNLVGADGNDTITGGTGNDTLNGGNGLDSLSGGAGNDSLLGEAGDDVMNGDTGNDTLSGGNGNDTLNGDNDNDSLFGGGNDDSISGGSGDDTLDGSSGIDTLKGGQGNDDYLNVGVVDVLTEFSNQGFDRVFSNVSYTLGNHFEYLELNSGSTGTGNSLDNTLVGNSGANTLSGLGGVDVLSGRAGNDSLFAGVDAVADQFVFDTALNAATNVDTLFEAEWPEDQILLDNDIFTTLLSTLNTNQGLLGAGYYFEGAGFTGSALNSAIGIYYNLTGGSLYYNPTANVAGDSVLFAIVNGASNTLSNTDFTLYTDVP